MIKMIMTFTRMGRATGHSDFVMKMTMELLAATPERVLDTIPMLREWASELLKLERQKYVDSPEIGEASMFLVESAEREFNTALDEYVELHSDNDEDGLDNEDGEWLVIDASDPESLAALFADRFADSIGDLDPAALAAAFMEQLADEAFDMAFWDIVSTNFPTTFKGILDSPGSPETVFDLSSEVFDKEYIASERALEGAEFEESTMDTSKLFAQLSVEVASIAKQVHMTRNPQLAHPSHGHDQTTKQFVDDWRQRLDEACSNGPVSLAQFVTELVALADSTAFMLVGKTAFDEFCDAQRRFVGIASQLTARI